MTDEGPHLRPVPLDGAETAEAIDIPAEPEPGTGLVAPSQRGGRQRFLSDVIVELGFLARERVDAAVDEARASGRTPEQVLLQTGALQSDQIARATAERFGLDFVDLSIFKLDLAAVNLVTPQAVRRYHAVPIGFAAEGVLYVAMTDPSNVLAIDDLKLMTGHEIRPVVATADDIVSIVVRMNRLDKAIAEAVEEDEEIEPVAEIRESAEDAPVIKLVNSVIAQAIEEGASDIHFEPDGRDMRVRFRIDGVLSESTSIPRRMVAGTVSRVKIMGDLDIAERRLPQDGRVTLAVEGRHVDIRIVTLPSVHGEGIVMRLLDKSQALLELDKLGMRAEERERFERAFHQAYGAVLVTGPTGSGKSTTLYSAMNAINSIDKNIITIEDPVEYQLPGVNQIQVNNKAGLTFADGLRSMLRADPDVIMVGEIRDSDTARIAVESALTGHLVLSTLHTNDAPSAITRLTEMQIEPFLTASAVDCVVAQRLARQLCTLCKKRTMLSLDALRASGFDVRYDVEGYEPVGCARCGHSGYKGRIGMYEVMLVSDAIRSMTIERTSADRIRAKAIEEGMRPLQE
ncbi:MAG: Flp pilus assembly complex ATPase component TadA, partial [Thermoleophilaceae bacterium]|nr:Flp pilus assembly complex ATPase component TadA [Thermoleophilaceae bacterium]